MQLITRTVEVSVIVLDHTAARQMLKRRDCDDVEIEQMKEYVRQFPEILREQDFYGWLKAHKEDIMRLAQEVWTEQRAGDVAREEAERTERKRMTGDDDG